MAKKKSKTRKPPPPKTHREFGKRYPKLGKAWELIGIAGREGPLDDKTARLVKLGVAMGAMREATRAQLGKIEIGIEGISEKEIGQVVALAAGALGMSSTAAVFTWVRDVTKGRKK